MQTRLNTKVVNVKSLYPMIRNKEPKQSVRQLGVKFKVLRSEGVIL